MSQASRKLAEALRNHALRAAAYTHKPIQLAKVRKVNPIEVELMSARGVLSADDDGLLLTQWVQWYHYNYVLVPGDTLVVQQLQSEDWVAFDVLSSTETRKGLDESAQTATTLPYESLTVSSTTFDLPDRRIIRKIPFYGPDGNVLCWVPGYATLDQT